MPDISHSDAPVFVLIIFLIALLISISINVISYKLEKKNFPRDRKLLKKKHDHLHSKGKFKTAISLCYSYLKKVESKEPDEISFVYNLVSEDLHQMESSLDAVYFAKIALRLIQKNYLDDSCLTGDTKNLKQELKSRVTELKDMLSEEELLTLENKIKIFDKDGTISYPPL